MKRILLISFLTFIIIGCDSGEKEAIQPKRPVTPMEFNHRISILKENVVDMTFASALFMHDEFLEMYENPELFIDTVKHKLKHFKENVRAYHKSEDAYFYYCVLKYSMYRGSLNDYIDICDIVIEGWKKQNIPSEYLYRLFRPIGKKNILSENKKDQRVVKLVYKILALENLDSEIKSKAKGWLY